MSESYRPGWRDADGEREFVVTLAVAEDLDSALATADAVLDQERFVRRDDRIGECRFIATAAVAAGIGQALDEALAAADVYLRPVDQPAARLLICDMDMTIVAAETLDEVAAELGLGERIADTTRRAMHGELDFNAALRERIGMLAGHDEAVFRLIAERVAMNPGARELVAGANAAGVHTILISGGFVQVAEPVAQELGFDELVCNRLDLDGGKLTGTVPEPIVNAEFKEKTLRDRAAALGVSLDECCAIGDGANDRLMIGAAGLGIAYRGKPLLRDWTDCRLDHADLSAALYFMGLKN